MTSTAINSAVHRVISGMRANLSQELTIDDMARTAMFSKFHFTRVFREVTGTSPGRYLSALRLQEAKRLLLETEFTIADISSQVGYSSVGTFSSRFKSCIGLSPSMFRQLRGLTTRIALDEQLSARLDAPVASRPDLEGLVALGPGREPGFCFLGLFPTPVPQGRPVRCAVLDGPGPFALPSLPVGEWHLLVHSVPYGRESAPSGTDGADIVSVGRFGPLHIQPWSRLTPVTVRLRPLEVTDPPILMALKDLRVGALA
ncbi:MULTISPECIES: helix-turn-helix domain-containing protein [unclassified Streptomyces]|uniref:helix-turn-helix domain-containing protein n=1 Tax=unclassified Streptomyces TaxID=2593676 RepID=UPI000CD5465A|nr:MULTISPECIES: AraC family transcriptional regulator [unclassified Streptomyces]